MKASVVIRTLCPIIAFFFLCSCSKDPEVIIKTETITVIDTITITDTVTVIETIVETAPDTTTTFILVRHAETTGGGSNPNLSPEGQIRAEELRHILANVPLDAIFSTNFNRTIQTATPVATASGLTIQTYDPFAPDVLIDLALQTYHNGIILIVGHSNTVPAFVNTLVGAEVYDDFEETEYGNLMIVYAAEKGRAQV